MDSLKDLVFEPIPGISPAALTDSNASGSLLATQLNVKEYHKEIRLPIVCILNGTGGSGKNTFTQLCRKTGLSNLIHCSTISEVKKAAELLINWDDRDCTRREVVDKSEAYRLFLHRLKIAWSEFNNGSTRYICDYIRDIISDVIADKVENPVVIFVDVREPEEIEKLKSVLTKLDIITTTILIEGMVDPSSHQNDSDKNVENYHYDYVITNHPGDLDSLYREAQVFTAKILRFFYGIDYTAKCRSKFTIPNYETE